MFNEIYEPLSYILNKKRDTVLAIIGIIIGLFSGLPKYVAILFIIITIVLLWQLIKESISIRKIFKEKKIPLMVIIGRNDDEYAAMVSDVILSMKDYGFEKQSFEDDFNIDQENYVIRKENNLTEDSHEWERQVHIFENKVIKLSAKLKGRKIFYLFLNSPAALVIGMGAVLGTKYEVVLHHHQLGMGENPYHPVIDFHSMEDNKEGIHLLKSRITSPNKFIEIEEPEILSSSIIVSLYLAGHDPKGDVEKIATKRNISVIHLRNKTEGTLPLDADWLRVVREVSTYLLNLSARNGIETIELYMSTPIVIAFALGMALGTQSPIRVYQWFSKDKMYYPVLDLNKLRQVR